MPTVVRPSDELVAAVAGHLLTVKEEEKIAVPDEHLNQFYYEVGQLSYAIAKSMANGIHNANCSCLTVQNWVKRARKCKINV